MILQIILTPILIYLGINVIYYFAFSLASKVRRRPVSGKQVNIARMAVFIPAYKEDAVIAATARKALEQNYPACAYDVVVIADSLRPSTMQSLYDLPIKVIEAAFEQSTKTKAINTAIDQLQDSYEVAVVLDADNIMETDFLRKVNEAFQAGCMAIQGHRTAKNNENPMAVLDGLSEEINNAIFRKGHVRLGLSSALIGSGMAFDYQLFRHHMSRIEAIGGFDKELELQLLHDRVKIHYLEDAIVYDEKVSSSQVFERQRTRWLAAQFRYAYRSFPSATCELITKRKIDYFDKSFQFLLMPRLMLLGMMAIISLLAIFLTPEMGSWAWTMTSTYIFTLAMAIPGKHYNRQLLGAAVHLPLTFWSMLKATMKYRTAATKFLHTPHQTVQS